MVRPAGLYHGGRDCFATNPGTTECGSKMKGLK